MSTERLKLGDRVFHPLFGPGTVSNRGSIDRDGQPVDYYTVRLDSRAVLQVPVDRAEATGLRLPVNGVQAITAYLQTPAEPLPDAPLMRMQALRVRWKAPQPGVIPETVRDLLARRMSPGDHRWMDQAVERLSTEAAMVDQIQPTQAHAAIVEAMDRLTPVAGG